MISALEFFRSLGRTFAAFLAVAAALFMLAAFYRNKAQAARLKAGRERAVADYRLGDAAELNQQARDAKQRANSIKREFETRRDALKSGGHLTAAQILDKLNKHARIDR